MALDIRRVKAILFDYGNTVIQFSRLQVDACDAALATALERLFGPVDRERLRAIRDADRITPYNNGLREQDLSEICAAAVRNLFEVEPTSDQVAALVRARFDAIVEVIVAPDYAAGLLGRLRERHRLGLVSNYPDGDAIRESLRRTGLGVFFDAVVVSGDVGRVKPHPLPFERCLERLGLTAAEVVFVGDNWLADVQGAKRLGMQTIHSIQWESPEHFDRQPGDFDPDVTISHLTQIETLFDPGMFGRSLEEH